MQIKYKIKAWIGKKIRACLEAYIFVQNQEDLSKLKYVGKQVKLNGEVFFRAPENIEIHDNVHIGDSSLLEGRGGLIIEENTHISRNFTVYTSSHCYESLRLPYDETYILKPVRIGRNVWIGSDVIIVPGVEIGEGSIIGAGCVISRDVPALAIVGSQPFRVLKERNKEHYFNLDSAKEYGGVSGREIESNLSC